MELDQSLIKSSGAQLAIEKQIPKDGICVVKILPA
jgi:hypothetical protein